MEGAHAETRRLLVDARAQLEALEHASGQGLDPDASDAVLAAYRSSVRALGEATERLRSQAGRRTVWQARVRDLDDQLAELRSADARIVASFRRIRREKQLLAGPGGRPAQGADIAIAMGPVDESRTLDRASTGAAGILASGSAALNSLLSQRRRLKGAKTRMLDVMNSIGVDRKIIAKIETRDNADRLLLYLCMAVLIIILFLAYWLKRTIRHHHGG